MGQRSVGETIAGIYQAFLRRRKWSQADLARQLGITSAALGKRLTDLSIAGMPLTSTPEHPHVVWRVPPDWFPGGVLLEEPDALEVARLLSRGRPSKQRAQLLAKVAPSTVSPPEDSEPEEAAYLSVIEDSRRKKKALRMRYFTASRGAMELRHVSVAKILYDPPVRFVAECHRDSRLKWFRADGVLAGDVSEGEPYRASHTSAVTAFIRESVDGFRDREPIACAFFVRFPESRWVARNLPWPLRGEDSGDGVLVQGHTGGLLRVARFVVSLGDAATARTPELAALVKELAEGALHLNGHSVPSIRASGSGSGRGYGEDER
jgi:predicted DNA-binding transcriptional regulator YafY